MLVRNQDLVISEILKCLKYTSAFIYLSFYWNHTSGFVSAHLALLFLLTLAGRGHAMGEKQEHWSGVRIPQFSPVCAPH